MNYDIKIINSLEKKTQRKRLLKIAVVYFLKKQFQKTAESIKIDDKWYEEDEEGNVVEIPVPVSEDVEPESLTIDIRGHKYIFVEGQVYSDNAGNYSVLEILPDEKFKVKYEDGRFSGQEKVYSALSRAKIIHNERIRRDQVDKMRTLVFDRPGEGFTLGFLASNGYLWIEVPIYHVQNFKETYERLTNESPLPYRGHGYGILKDDGRYRPVQYRIAFPFVTEIVNMLEFPTDVNIVSDRGHLNINNTNYLKNLLKLGFRIGHNKQNVNKILNNLSEFLKDDFMRGLNFKPGESEVSV